MTMLGKRHSTATRARISEIQRGRKASLSTKRRQSAAMKRWYKHASPVWRADISAKITTAKTHSILWYEQRATRTASGCLIYGGSRKSIARKLFMRRHGPLPSHLFVCHTCDEPLCIEDTHHFVGTNQDNIADAVAKGRKKHTQETKNKVAQAKLGKKRPTWVRMKLSIALTGRKLSAEHRTSISRGLRRFHGR